MKHTKKPKIVRVYGNVETTNVFQTRKKVNSSTTHTTKIRVLLPNTTNYHIDDKILSGYNSFFGDFAQIGFVRKKRNNQQVKTMKS